MYKIIFLFLLIFCNISNGAEKPKKPDFKNFITHKDFKIDIDLNSIRVVKGPEYPMISLDTQFIMTSPVKEPKTQKFIKSIISTVAADCKNDQLIMIKSTAYNLKGALIASDGNELILKNPNDKNSPATNLLILICDLSALANEKIKMSNDPMRNI